MDANEPDVAQEETPTVETLLFRSLHESENVHRTRLLDGELEILITMGEITLSEAAVFRTLLRQERERAWLNIVTNIRRAQELTDGQR